MSNPTIALVSYFDMNDKVRHIQFGREYFCDVSEDWVFPDDMNTTNVYCGLVTMCVQSIVAADVGITIKLSFIDIANQVDRFPSYLDVTVQQFDQMINYKLIDDVKTTALNIPAIDESEKCCCCQDEITKDTGLSFFPCSHSICKNKSLNDSSCDYHYKSGQPIRYGIRKRLYIGRNVTELNDDEFVIVQFMKCPMCKKTYHQMRPQYQCAMYQNFGTEHLLNCFKERNDLRDYFFFYPGVLCKHRS